MMFKLLSFLLRITLGYAIQDIIPHLNLTDLLVLDSEEEVDGDDSGTVQDPETECLCCYEEYPAADMMECKAGSEHFVCKQCINHFVSEQLDGNDSVTFKCIANPDCMHEYSYEKLDGDGALSPRLKGRMNDRVFREMVKQAGLGDEWTCPKCAYMGFIDRQHPWIECPQCNVQYCTSCNDTYHQGKTCEDARQAKARIKDPKHRAHEAMSQACKRFCPHCNQEYVKSDGCNKIKCKCGELSCYLCGEKVEGYSHYCSGPSNCPCPRTCRLWTSTEAMEKIDRARRQAAGRKFLVEEGITNNKEIDSILASPPPKSTPTQAGILRRANIRNVNFPDIVPRVINLEPARVVQRANQLDRGANAQRNLMDRIMDIARRALNREPALVIQMDEEVMARYMQERINRRYQELQMLGHIRQQAGRL